MSAVTVISSGPMCAITATYMAVSAAAIRVGPDSTRPGRCIHSR